MNVYLLRHGLAADADIQNFAKDSDRPLTPKGKRKVWKIAEGMAALDLAFDLILSSPYLRARQTAEIVAEVFKARKRLEFSDTLTPGGSAKKLVELLKKLESPAADVLLVGHEPYLSELIALLVAGQIGFSVVMKKGGLCKLSTVSLRAGRCAALEWLLAPKQLVLLG
jgi:phosphohistidine phosphatase